MEKFHGCLQIDYIKYSEIELNNNSVLCVWLSGVNPVGTPENPYFVSKNTDLGSQLLFKNKRNYIEFVLEITSIFILKIIITITQ